MPDFDPNAAARPGSGVFGLPHGRDEAECVLVPVPFDATTSYRDGARDGPAAIRRASLQVDLFDLQTGRPYERGIHMLEADPRIAALCRSARAAAEPLIEQGGAGPGDEAAVELVDRAGAEVDAIVAREVAAICAAGKLPGVVGGDHSVPLGAIRAAAAHHGPIGVLHVDAHADLRRAYEGFRWSHASIMDNVLREVPDVVRISQVGIRDFCEEELERIRACEGRVVTWFELDWRRRLAAGERLLALCDEVVASLPERVWISFDIDGLDPALCPHTGTPVPGGLSFAEACLLLEAVQRGGRRIVGFDLNEVVPGPDGDEWDAAVGARLLYKLCGFALLTR
jgi:agmatinase